jgi:TetR/AcrR family transcriptional regulator
MERESRQRFILDAARRLFASRGIEEATMEEIAAEVGYTRRTLYAYFRSREEILLQVLSEDLRSRWALQKEAITRGATGLEKVRIWAQVLYAVSRDNPQTLRLQIYSDFKGINRKRTGDDAFSRFEAANQELAEGLREIFRLGVADGSLRGDLNIDLCISQFLQSLRAVLHRALSPHYSFASFEPDDYVDHYLDLFCRAIRNDEGRLNV